MVKEKAIQVWAFTNSQKLLIEEQARIHQNEHAPLHAYQSRAQNDLLLSFREELDIPEGMLLTVDLNTLQFTERVVPRDNVPVPVPDDDDPGTV